MFYPVLLRDLVCPRFDKREADLLSTLNRIEVEKEEETSTLFRSATLTTALMDLYMRSVCTEFLSTAIFPTIHRILEASARGGQSCELNPSKIESAAEACANAEFLLQVLDDITESIFMSSEACPRTLRYGFQSSSLGDEMRYYPTLYYPCP